MICNFAVEIVCKLTDEFELKIIFKGLNHGSGIGVGMDTTSRDN